VGIDFCFVWAGLGWTWVFCLGCGVYNPRLGSVSFVDSLHFAEGAEGGIGRE
jgi:hypothetical protein